MSAPLHSKALSQCVEEAARQILAKTKPTGDQIITEYLGGMPANREKARLHHEHEQRQMPARDRYHKMMRRRYPKWNDKNHGDHKAYAARIESSSARWGARVGAAVAKTHPALVREAEREQRQWHTIANMVFDRATQLKREKRSGG